ncbi:MAG: Ig-like domain-containing protein [Bacteroidota bacterium]
MKKLTPPLAILATLLFWSCIGDDFINDFVQPEIRLSAAPDSLTIDSSFQYSARYFNNVGIESDVDLEWSSSDPAVASIDQTGMVTAHALGTVDISARFDDGMNPAVASVSLHTAENPIVIVEEEPDTLVGRIETTTFYVLEGDFTLYEDLDAGTIVLSIADDYRASSALPGLYVYLTNNPNTIVNAYEIGEVDVFQGAHEYVIPDVAIDAYSHILYFCKPFTVKVGDGEIVEP